MENTTQKTNIRWLYLAVGTFAMLFAGILYAWSILKAPFSVEFGWSQSHLPVARDECLWQFALAPGEGRAIPRQ